MSIAVSTIISNANTELQINGQRIDGTDMLVYVNKAIKYFYQTYKLPMAERESNLLLFNGVREYPIPSDFAGLIEPKRPYELDSPQLVHTTQNELVHWLKGNQTAFKFIRDRQILVVDYQGGTQIRISACESLTEDGTWAISGDGSALALDEQIYTEGQASISFTITASGGTTTVSLTGFSSLDLTDYLANSYVFLDLDCPNDTSLVSVALRIGSDASNYYEVSGVTTRYRGDTIGQGNAQIGFNMASRTTTGSPDATALDYFALVITNGTNSVVNGTYRLDNIFLSQAVYFQLPYYSKNIVKTNSSAYQSTVTNSNDTIMMPFDTEEAIEWKALELAAVLSLKDQTLANYFARELLRVERNLTSKYPSQESRVQTTWYKQANKF